MSAPRNCRAKSSKRAVIGMCDAAPSSRYHPGKQAKKNGWPLHSQTLLPDAILDMPHDRNPPSGTPNKRRSVPRRCSIFNS